MHNVLDIWTQTSALKDGIMLMRGAKQVQVSLAIVNNFGLGEQKGWSRD